VKRHTPFRNMYIVTRWVLCDFISLYIVYIFVYCLLLRKWLIVKLLKCIHYFVSFRYSLTRTVAGFLKVSMWKMVSKFLAQNQNTRTPIGNCCIFNVDFFHVFPTVSLEAPISCSLSWSKETFTRYRLNYK
jgi:hypothetical protein